MSLSLSLSHSHSPLPDLESLACVDALARTLKFHAAARARFLSPAAFSKRIQQVEEHVGAPLFSRTTRSVALTDAGRALVPQVRALLVSAVQLSSTKAQAAAQITIGTRHELGMSWLMPARRALQERMPHLTVHLRFGSTDELERLVLALAVDAIVTSRAPSTTRLDAVPLAREDYAFVASPKLLARVPLRTTSDAAAHTLVDADDSLPLFSYVRASGQAPRFARVLTLGTIAAIRAAVLAGEGVAVLPRYFVDDELAKKRLARVLPRAHLGHDWFRVVFRADDPQRTLLESVATALAAMPFR